MEHGAFGTTQDAPSRAGQPRLAEVELLRGLAALAVAWFHLTNTWSPGLTRASGHYGWLGVEAFFVISGFVIPYGLASTNYRFGDYWRFLARRFARLEPPYFASILLAIGIGAIAAATPWFRGPPPDVSWQQVAFHLFYLIPLTHYSWLSFAYWTLAYEFVFYLLAGLFWPVLYPRHLAVTAVFFAAAELALWKWKGHWDALPLLFFTGIAICRYRCGRDTRATMLVAIAASAAAQVAMGHAIEAAAGFVTALIVAFVRLGPHPLITLLGGLSYSLYLIHVPIGTRVVNLGRRFGDGPWRDFAVSAAAMLASLAVAYVFYKLIDRPASRLARRIALHSDEVRGSPAAV